MAAYGRITRNIILGHYVLNYSERDGRANLTAESGSNIYFVDFGIRSTVQPVIVTVVADHSQVNRN